MENNNINIICNSCNSNNEIAGTENFICTECNKPLKGIYKKVFISALYFFLISGSAGFATSHYFTENRLPIQTEYEIVYNCVHGYTNYQSKSFYKKKTQICSEALEKTLEEVEFSNNKEEKEKFMTTFNYHVFNN